MFQRRLIAWLINPAVGARRRLVFLFTHIHFKALFVSLILPIRNAVAHVVEKRSAPQIYPADKHSAEMAEVAYTVVAKSNGSQKCKNHHDGNRGAHADGDRDEQRPDLAVGEQNGARDQNSKNCSGSSDCWHVGKGMAPKDGNGFYDDVDDAGADAGNKIILEEAISSPDDFQFAAKHPQGEHVGKNMPDGIRVVEKEIGNGLPDSEAGHYGGRNQTKPKRKMLFRQGAPKNFQQHLKNIDGKIGD